MAGIITYNSSNIKIVSPEPLAGGGGQALTDNFQIVGDHIMGSGSQHTININKRISGTGTLTADDKQQFFTNDGVTSYARVGFNLPSAASGLSLSFGVVSSGNLTITAATADRIRVGSVVSASGGYMYSSGVGSTVELLAPNNDDWFATSTEGSWFIQTA